MSELDVKSHTWPEYVFQGRTILPKKGITYLRLKGEYENYTWGYGQNPLDYPVS